MTRYAPPNACRCQSCGGYFSRRGIASFSTFGATRWSDGFINTWTIASDQNLGRCPTCKALLWPPDYATEMSIPSRPRPISAFKRFMARLTGDRQGILSAEQAWFDCPAAIRDCNPMLISGLDDYREALSVLTLSPQREIYVRKQILWRSNDHQRHLDGENRYPKQYLSSSERIQNLLALDALFSDLGDERDWLLHGEVLRLLGRFDEALTTLARESKNPEMAGKIANFAHLRSKDVQVV